MRPQISPDGKFLAFVRRVRLNTELFIQDLQTGEEWSVYEDLTHDQQEAWAIFGLIPILPGHPTAGKSSFMQRVKSENLRY